MSLGDHLENLKEKLEPVLEKLAGLKDKLAPLKEKAAPLLEKLDPIWEKLEPLRDKFDDLTEPKCRKCGADEPQRSERNPIEKVVSMVIPMRPYRCGGCDRRYMHFTKPLFDRTRAISFAVILLLFGLVIADQIIRRMPDPPPEVAEQEAVEDNVPPDLPLPGETEEEAAPDTDKLAEPPEEIEQPGSRPEPGEVWSPRVVAQLERNLAKQRGENVGDSTIKLPKKRDGVGVTREKKTIINDDKPPTPTPTPTPTAKPVNTTATKPAQTSASGLTFQGLEAIEESGTFSLTFKGNVQAHKAFALNNRYVVDLLGNWTATGLKSAYPVNGTLVKQVRTSRSGDKIRLVVDLNVEKATPVITKDGEALKLTLN